MIFPVAGFFSRYFSGFFLDLIENGSSEKPGFTLRFHHDPNSLPMNLSPMKSRFPSGKNPHTEVSA
ncbi:MAG: hypothetical protein P8X63_02345 [Desulfuromonadaceae bacterium]